MGQRTAILLKKNYKNNRSTINLIHHQWGIGKVMPMLFLQELMRVDYKLDRSYPTYKEGEPIDNEFTFSPLSSEYNNYIYNREVKTDEVDVFDVRTAKEFFDQTDNNNGGMVIEITQKYYDNGEPKEYGDMFDIKIGFMLGSEECYWGDGHFRESAKIEEDFTRFVSADEFMMKTWGNSRKNGASTKKFIKAWKNLLEIFGIETVVDTEKAKEIEKKVERMDAIAKVYTEGKKADGTLPLPKEFDEKVELFR